MAEQGSFDTHGAARPDATELLAQASWLRALTRRLIRDVDLASDLEQETWSATLQGGPADPSGARAWMRAVVRKLFLRHLRDEGARVHHESRAAQDVPTVSSEEQSTLERLELQERLVVAVQSLDEPYRTAVRLRYFDGLEYDEVAERMATTPVTARKRVSRGVEALRELLDRPYGGREHWSILALSIAAQATPTVANPGPPVASTVTVGESALAWLGGAGMSGTMKFAGAALGTFLLGVAWWGLGRGSGVAVSHPLATPGVGVDMGLERRLRRESPSGDLDKRGAVTLPVVEVESTDAAFEPETRIQGRVIDAEGEPIPGAAVQLTRVAGAEYRLLDRTFSSTEVVLGSHRTGQDGSFDFEVVQGRGYQLIASFPGLCRARVDDAYGGDEVVLRLMTGAVVHGSVTGADGFAAPGARVSIRSTSKWDPEEPSTTTDPTGGYRFEGLAPGEYLIEINSSVGATPPWVGVHLAASESRRVDFELKAGVLIVGRVTDAVTGDPISGAEVCESWVFEKVVRTDHAGEFRFEDFPGQSMSEIAIRAEGYARRRVDVRGLRDLDARRDSLEIELTPAIRITGRVVDAEGQPVPDAYVSRMGDLHRGYPRQHDPGGGPSGSDGRFQLDDVSTEVAHSLFVQKDGFGTRFYELGITAEDTDVGDIVMREGVLVQGRVVDARGEPLRDRRVMLTGGNSDRGNLIPEGRREFRDTTLGMRSVFTNDRGRFRFADVSEGTYSIEARSQNIGEPRARRDFEVSAGNQVDLGDLEIDEGLTISGFIVGPDGTEVEGAWVVAYAEDPAGEAQATRSREDGAFTVGGLAPGTYRLELGPKQSSDRHPYRDHEVHGITAGRSDVLIEMPLGSRLRGRVLNSQGHPSVHATIRMLIPDLPERWAHSDEEGRFELIPPMGTTLTLIAHPLSPEADKERPFLSDRSPERSVRLEGVSSEGPEVLLRFP